MRDSGRQAVEGVVKNGRGTRGREEKERKANVNGPCASVIVVLPAGDHGIFAFISIITSNGFVSSPSVCNWMTPDCCCTTRGHPPDIGGKGADCRMSTIHRHRALIGQHKEEQEYFYPKVHSSPRQRPFVSLPIALVLCCCSLASPSSLALNCTTKTTTTD